MKRVELNSVMILSMFRLDMDKEIGGLKNENSAAPVLSVSRKWQQIFMIYRGHTRN